MPIRRRRETKRAARAGLLASLLAVLCAPPIGADPVDLEDETPRWIAVRFEISPANRPGQTDRVYTPPFPAWLEPAVGENEVRITVEGSVVERHLLPDHDPVPGSFSDFVWHFDPESGHVVHAEADGELRRRLGWRLETTAEIRIRMNTQRIAGFERPRRLFGNEYHRFCTEGPEDCTVVAPRAYDPFTGYVNAVGNIDVQAGPLSLISFSPLGEAIFLELPDVAAPPPSVTRPPDETGAAEAGTPEPKAYPETDSGALAGAQPPSSIQ